MYLHGPVQADAALDARQAAAVLLILPGLLAAVLQVLPGRRLAEAVLTLPATAGRLPASVLQCLGRRCRPVSRNIPGCDQHKSRSVATSNLGMSNKLASLTSPTPGD